MTQGLLAGFRQVGMATGSFPHRSWFKLSADKGLAALAQDLGDTRPDVVVFGGYAPAYFEALGGMCHDAGAAFVYWAIEDPVGFERTLFLARCANHVFTTTAECIERYSEHGIRAALLLFAANPDYHRPGTYRPQLDLDLALAASFYGWKARMKGYEIILDAARDSGRSFRVWGAGWDSAQGRERLGDPSLHRGYLPNHMLPQLCASALIVLGVQSVDSSSTQTNMRPYEILGCRGFHLTQWTPAISGIFVDGQHLVTATSREEALDKINHYAARESERSRIAECGQAHVYREHTYLHRVRDVVMPALRSG